MNALLFCWHCVMTMVEAGIGFLFLSLFFWGMVKVFRPPRKVSRSAAFFPRRPGPPGK